MSPPWVLLSLPCPISRCRWMAAPPPKEDIGSRREERRGCAPLHLANSHSGFLLRQPLPWDTIPGPSGQGRCPRPRPPWLPCASPSTAPDSPDGDLLVPAQLPLLTVFPPGDCRVPGTQEMGPAESCLKQMAHSSKATEEGW